MESLNLTPDITCPSCVGACCRVGSEVFITEDEAGFLRESGTILEVSEVESPADYDENNRTFYRLTTDCGNLVYEDGWNQCIAYNNPYRPNACGEFVAGSKPCMQFREEFGVKLVISRKT